MNAMSSVAARPRGLFASRLGVLWLALAAVLLMVSITPDAHAGTSPAPGFDDMFTFLTNLLQGALGKILGVIALIVAMVGLLAARAGLGLINVLLIAFGSAFGIAIITGIVTATV